MATGMYKEHPLIDCNMGPGSPVLSTDLLLAPLDPYTPLSNDFFYNASHIYRLQIAYITSKLITLQHNPLRMSYLTPAESIYIKSVARYCRNLVKAAKVLYNPKAHCIHKLVALDYGNSTLLYNMDSMGLWVTCLLTVLERELQFQQSLHSNLNREVPSASFRFLVGAKRETEIILGKFALIFRQYLGITETNEMDSKLKVPTQPLSKIASPWRNFTPSNTFKVIDLGRNGTWRSFIPDLIESHQMALSQTTRSSTLRPTRLTPSVYDPLQSPVPATRSIEL